MRPDLDLPDDAEPVPPAPEVHGKGPLGPIFSGSLAPITLLLWLCFATTLMANFFLNSWMPILFEAKGVSTETAALVTSTYHIGAVLGGLAMSVLLDRWGFGAVAVMLALSAPAMLLIGLEGISPGVLAVLVTITGFCVLGAQFGNNAAAGLIYPTAYRSKGVGLAFGAGRIGSVLGPIVGAALIGRGMPLIMLLAVIAATLLLGAIAAVVLARLAYRRFGSLSLDESQAAERADEPGVAAVAL
jgi:AAHS family 4-hydroxybenzoate transporter-like MFS transporter